MTKRKNPKTAPAKAAARPLPPASSVTDLKHLRHLADAIRRLCRVTEKHGQRSPETQQAAISALNAMATRLPLLNKCRGHFGCYPSTREQLPKIEEWATVGHADKAVYYDQFSYDLTSSAVHSGGPIDCHSWGEQLDYWIRQCAEAGASRPSVQDSRAAAAAAFIPEKFARTGKPVSATAIAKHLNLSRSIVIKHIYPRLHLDKGLTCTGRGPAAGWKPRA